MGVVFATSPTANVIAVTIKGGPFTSSEKPGEVEMPNLQRQPYMLPALHLMISDFAYQGLTLPNGPAFKHL